MGFLGVLVFSFLSLGQAAEAGAPASNAAVSEGVALDEAALAERQKRFKTFESRFMGRKQQKSPEQRLREVSDMYEKHFLREMLKGMRSTVKEGGFVNANHAEKIFRDQLDEQYVEKWGQKGGIGLSDMIYEQLMDKFGQQMGIRQRLPRPRGPLPLDAASGNRIMPFKHPGKTAAAAYRIDPAVPPSGQVPGMMRASLGTQEIPAGPRRDVKAPWNGILKGSRDLVDQQTMLEIEHDNGLRSQIVFKGALAKVTAGEKIQAGDTVGFLSSEAKSLYWTVEPLPTSSSHAVSE